MGKKEGLLVKIFAGDRIAEKDSIISSLEIDIEKKQTVIENLKIKNFEKDDELSKIREYLKDLEVTKKQLDLENEKYKTTIEELEVFKVHSKQAGIYQKNLEQKERQNQLLHSKVEGLNKEITEEKNKIAELLKDMESLKKEKERIKKAKEKQLQITPSSSKKIEINKEVGSKFKVPVEIFFQSKKYKEVLEFLIKKKITYVDDIQVEKIKDKLVEVKNGDTSIVLVEDFNDNRYTFEVSTYMERGPYLSSIFAKNSKFYRFLESNYIEFYSDLDGFDFDLLKEKGFTPKQIKDAQDALKSYVKSNIATK